MMANVRAVVFDVGGVFRDSERAMHRCFTSAFSKHGCDFQFDSRLAYQLRGLESFNNLLHATKALYITKGEGLRHYLDSSDGEQQLNDLIASKARCLARADPRRGLCGEIDEQLVTGVRDEYQRLFASDEVKELITMYQGAEESVVRLKERGYILGVLSNGSRKALERDLGHLFAHFAFAVTEADKPDPTKYLEALQSIGVAPHETIYVGDAVSDVVMAKRAGSVAVALLCGMGTEAHLRQSAPDHIHASLQAFVADNLLLLLRHA